MASPSTFSCPPSAPELPEPIDLSHHLTRTTLNREASSVKQFYKFFTIPGIAQLAGGLPNDKCMHPHQMCCTMLTDACLIDTSHTTPSKQKSPTQTASTLLL